MTGCKESQITINTATLEKIVFDPRAVLANEESFWENERPQKLTRKWAGQVNYDIPFDKWRAQVGEWAELSLDERQNHVLMQNTRKIIEAKGEFVNKAIPHLCSYLPQDADLNVAIQLTAFIPPSAFACEDIVISINSPYWKDNVENVLNLLAHEIFHAGYSYCRDLMTDEKLEDETLYRMLDNFHSEGICTYVGYQALSLFPAPDVDDYTLLDSPGDVKRLLDDVNGVFAKADELPDDKLQQLAWEKCVIGRGYYVVGAYMCRVIEENKGRDALINNLLQGPISFIKLYNSLVGDKMKVRVRV
jgi:hypothetical protein